MTSEEIIEMVEYCECKECKDKKECNGVDLINCYIIKKGVLKI